MALNRLAGGGAQNPYLRTNGRPLSYRRLLRRPKTDPVLVDVANYTQYFGRCGDGLSPIIFDDDGSIIDDIVGTGASQVILGLTFPDCGTDRAPGCS